MTVLLRITFAWRPAAPVRHIDIPGIEGESSVRPARTGPRTKRSRSRGKGPAQNATFAEDAIAVYPLVCPDEQPSQCGRILDLVLNTNGTTFETINLNSPRYYALTFVEVGPERRRMPSSLDSNNVPIRLSKLRHASTTPDRFSLLCDPIRTPAATSLASNVDVAGQIRPTDVRDSRSTRACSGPRQHVDSIERDDQRSTSFPAIVSDLSPGPQRATMNRQSNSLFRLSIADGLGTVGPVLSTGKRWHVSHLFIVTRIDQSLTGSCIRPDASTPSCGSAP